MGDNSTPHAADVYEAEVRRTIPFHAELLRTAVSVALAAVPEPARWLDTGCGPGRVVGLARERAPRAAFFMADPSAAMLAQARANNPELGPDSFFQVPSASLPDAAPFDVITAVQCHHYGDAAARERAVGRCRELLAPGGVLVVFENVRAETDAGHDLQRRRYAAWLRAEGRDDDAIRAQLAREGTSFFPLRVSEHLALFARLGFVDVEVVWRAYGQAGLVGRVPS